MNDQITDSVTQMIGHANGIADNLSTLLTVLNSFKGANGFIGLSQQDRQLIMAISGDASSAMMNTERVLEQKNR